MTNTIIDREATLGRFSDEERERFHQLEDRFLRDLAGADGTAESEIDGITDEGHAMRKAMCRALGLPGYTEGIWSIDPSLNPVGVEEFMRIQHHTLNHLPHEEFVREAAMARVLEDEQPGELAKFAHGIDGKPCLAYRQAEKLVQPKRRIVVPGKRAVYRKVTEIALPPRYGSAAFPSL